ncbi:hypothetical protein B0H66DRAFT_602358 [Apodospora peruviana]|uniref:Cytochrome P450 n=1 Tax=Apodospora peruviana TaxID=516989 RepID=A0AAE0IDD0_9PEZI|nr:hypothetical protein B0H66DRAFT_602358 [Apodospora peruviana]
MTTPVLAVVTSAALVTVYILAKQFRSRASWSSPSEWKTGKPVIGVRNEWFSWERASLHSFSLSKYWSLEGYAKYGKANTPYIMPCVERGPVVIIPPRQINHIWNTSVYTPPFQFNVVRHQMTRNLDVLTPVIATELEAAFEQLWGTDENDWKEVRLWNSCLDLISRVSNAAFCGAPLSKDAAFLNSLRDHGMFTFLGALLISATPLFLRPITGNLTSWACELQFLRVKRRCLPFIKERLANTARALSDPRFCWTAPVSISSIERWSARLIEESYATQDPTQLDPVRITRRLIYINVSLHSTSYTMQNVIPDISTTQLYREKSLLEALRKEASTVLAQAGGVWTRDVVQKLKLADAAIHPRVHEMSD